MTAQQQLAELIATPVDARDMNTWASCADFVFDHGPAIAELIEAAKAANALYGRVWDRTDGALVVFPDNVQRFDETFERLHQSLAPLTEPK